MDISLEKPFETVSEKINTWLEALVAMLPNMAVAIVLFIVFFMLAKLVQKLFLRLFHKASNNKSLENLFGTVIYYLVLGVGIFIVLGVLQLDKTVTSLLAGVGVMGLALGFAFQDVASNFVSGVILAFRRPSKIGDIIEVKDYMGTVVRTNLRVTILKTFQGQEVFIPNREVLQNPMINYSALGERRVDIAVGVSYGDDLKKVEKLVKDTISNMEGVIRKDDLIFDYYEFGGSSINFYIRFWIEFPGQPQYLAMRTKAIMAIKKAFDENDITIPFPIRTLDFGIKGGEKLSEMKLMAAATEE